MAFVDKQVAIEAPPETVWAIGGDLAGIPAWMDSVESVRIEGELRHATLNQGRGVLVERITSHSDERMALTYELVSEGAPMRVYRASFAVAEAEGGSVARWTAEIEAADGVDEETLVGGIAASYEAGLENLRRLALEA